MNLKESQEKPDRGTADIPQTITQDPAAHGSDQPYPEVRSQGPLPPPELLARYKDHIPDAPERFLVMAEGQVAHRQKMEKWLVIGGTVRSYLGQAFAFIITLYALYQAADLIRNGHGGWAAVLFGSVLASIVIAFLSQSLSKSNIKQPEINPSQTDSD